MTSARGCCSSCEHFVKFKGVTTCPILFSHLMRHDGEGAINHEELFADDRSPAYEQERIHQDELYSLMNSILDWAISFLGESTQGTIRAIYFEGKTVKQHSEEEYVTVHAIYKRPVTIGIASAPAEGAPLFQLVLAPRLCQGRFGHILYFSFDPWIVVRFRCFP